MVYSQSQITDLRTKIIRKINAEIALALKNDAIDELLEKYGVELEEISYQSGVTRRSKILVLGQTTCGYCIKAKPILSKIADDYGITINYINVNTLTSEQSGKLSKYVSYLGENEWGTPLTLIVNNGKVVDSANGLLDEDGYVKLFKDNGFIK